MKNEPLHHPRITCYGSGTWKPDIVWKLLQDIQQGFGDWPGVMTSGSYYLALTTILSDYGMLNRDVACKCMKVTRTMSWLLCLARINVIFYPQAGTTPFDYGILQPDVVCTSSRVILHT